MLSSSLFEATRKRELREGLRRVVVPLKRIPIVAVSLLAALVTGCAYDPTFGFPIEEGDIAAGRQAFIDHRCHQCHSVAGVPLPELAGAPAPLLELGGETTSIKSYAELMTSIVNPNHFISERYRDRLLLNAEVPLESPMPTPDIDNMTVRQLIDLVAFLDSRYELIDDYVSSD
jgi:sulfur-oxidizing protein SoxX